MIQRLEPIKCITFMCAACVKRLRPASQHVVASQVAFARRDVHCVVCGGDPTGGAMTRGIMLRFEAES